jgi:hypothetical protein
MRLSHWGEPNILAEAVFTRAGASEYGDLAERSTNQGSSITCRRLGAYTNEIAGLTLVHGEFASVSGPANAVGSRDPNLKFADRFPRAADRLRSAHGPFASRQSRLRDQGALQAREATSSLSSPGSRSIPLVLAVAELDLDARHAGRPIQRAQDLAEARAELSGAVVLGQSSSCESCRR